LCQIKAFLGPAILLHASIHSSRYFYLINNDINHDVLMLMCITTRTPTNQCSPSIAQEWVASELQRQASAGL
jgi:hypothetical protein